MANEEYQNAVREILRGVQYMIEEATMKSQTQIYNGIYLGNEEVQLNGKVYTLPQYGGTSSPAVGTIVKVFVPNGNMSMAFFIYATEGGGGGGSVTNHNQLSGRSAKNQHPISAITNLEQTLNNINDLPEVTEANNNNIMRVVDGEWTLSPFYTITSNESGGNTLNL